MADVDPRQRADCQGTRALGNVRWRRHRSGAGRHLGGGFSVNRRFSDLPADAATIRQGGCLISWSATGGRRHVRSIMTAGLLLIAGLATASAQTIIRTDIERDSNGRVSSVTASSDRATARHRLHLRRYECPGGHDHRPQAARRPQPARRRRIQLLGRRRHRSSLPPVDQSAGSPEPAMRGPRVISAHFRRFQSAAWKLQAGSWLGARPGHACAPSV